MEIVGIHNHIDPRPALYVRQETPKHFKSIYEKDKFYDKKFKGWHDGIPGIITGMHKFFIDDCIIPDGFGRPIIPSWRDSDKELFDSWDSCVKNQDDLMVLKRRELILSTFGGGVAPLYNAFTNPGSDSVMTSASKTRLQSMFRKKLEFIYDRLDPYFREEKARKTQSGQLFIAKEDKATKTFSGLQSSIWSIDTVKDPYGFESFRASYIFIDEAWLHPKVSTVKSSANSSRMEGFQRLAPMLIGGTAGLADAKGTQEAIKVYKSSRETNTVVLFLGGTKSIKQFQTNGWTDEKAAEEWILKHREELAKSEDKTEYFKFLTSYPLSIEEVFNLITDCALPQEIQYQLNNAEHNIEVEGKKNAKYHIITNGTKIQANPDNLKGKITIVTPPVIGHTYIAGTDPIPFGNNLLGEGSDYSIIILDLDTMEFVADYTERNLNDMEVVSNSILLQKLYYRAPTMLELNRGEVVLKDYLAMGEQSLLAQMPTHLGIVWEDRKYPYGYAMTGGQGNQINARCEALCMKYLLAHGYKLRHKRLIHEFRKLSTPANTDLLSAAKGALLFAAELEEIKKINTFAPTVHRVRNLVRNSRGEMVYEIKTVELIR